MIGYPVWEFDHKTIGSFRVSGVLGGTLPDLITDSLQPANWSESAAERSSDLPVPVLV